MYSRQILKSRNLSFLYQSFPISNISITLYTNTSTIFLFKKILTFQFHHQFYIIIWCRYIRVYNITEQHEHIDRYDIFILCVSVSLLYLLDKLHIIPPNENSNHVEYENSLYNTKIEEFRWYAYTVYIIYFTCAMLKSRGSNMCTT